jgi:hypothetical protein
MVGASFAGPGGAHTKEVVGMTKSQSDDRRWIGGWGAILTLVAVVIPLGAGSLFGYSDKMLVYAGAVVTALVALIAHTLTRQSDRRLAVEQKQSFGQLKLEAAMRAGQLVSSKDGLSVDRAAAASSLLALTRLDQAGLAVAMLVDLWDGGKDKVSTETAILVIDGALRSDQRNAQLMAAELLCRNARNLEACQSLHWPSVIDGGWDPRFGDKTKLLLFEALLDMTLTTTPNENALRSVAVRLYGVWAAEAAMAGRSKGASHARVMGCVGTLIKAILPQMEVLGYTDFIQGDSRVTLKDFAAAAATAADNPDEFLHRIVARRAEELIAWSLLCDCVDLFQGSIASAVGQGGSLLLVVDRSDLQRPRSRPRSPRRACADPAPTASAPGAR